jgi:DNA-binding Xre family transcriptional regulator
MRNRINELIQTLGVSAYRFAEQTGITKNTVYLLKNNPSQFPSSEVFDRIITVYKVTPNDIVEWCPEGRATEVRSDGL